MGETDYIYIGCPNCGVRYRWRAELASKKILCPCGCKFRMPNVGLGQPTTITLPAKGNAVAGNAGIRPGTSAPDQPPPRPIAASDAVGELARLHLLDDLKQKIDNDGTLNSGRFVVPASELDRRRPGDSSGPVSTDGRADDEPVLPGVPDQPAHGYSHPQRADSMASVAHGVVIADSGATGAYELNLDAFTPASSITSPEDLANASSAGESVDIAPEREEETGPKPLSRAEIKRQRQAEMDEEIRLEEQRTRYFYPLGCAVVGMLLIFVNLLLLGPQVDEIKLGQVPTRNSGFIMVNGADDTTAPTTLDNSLVVPTREAAGQARATGAANSHTMPMGLIARMDNPNYAQQVANYRIQTYRSERFFNRSLGSIFYLLISVILSGLGILVCVKFMGTSVPHPMEMILKLGAISTVLEGALGCLNSVLGLITEGLYAEHGVMPLLLPMVLGLTLFWAMTAWLLKLVWYEVCLLYVLARLVAVLASGAFMAALPRLL